MPSPMRPLTAQDARTLKAVGLAVALLLAGLTVAKRADPDEVQFVLLPDAIPAISDPSFQDTGRSTDRVMGVAVNGEAKAYPISVLNFHEVVNDEVGGVPVVVTYCPLCATGVVYERTMADDPHAGDDGDPAPEPLTFKVSGRLYKNNLVMQDTRTGSQWSQAEGLGISGEYEGYTLTPVPSTITTLSVWRRHHPDTTVLEPPGGRDYSSDPYGGYDRSDDVLYPSDEAPGPLRPKAMVYGLVRGGEAVAFDYGTLTAERVVEATVGGTEVVVTYHEGAVQAFETGGRDLTYDGGFAMVDQDGVRWNMVTGQRMGGGAGGASNGSDGADASEAPANLTAMAGMPSFWFAWYNFHPDTRLHAQTVGAAPAGSFNFPLLHPLNLVVLGVLAFAAWRLGRFGLLRWRRRDGFASRDWFSPRHGWVNGILVGIVAAAVLYDASLSIQPAYRWGQGLLGAGLLVWGGALAVEWRLHRGRVVKPTNLDPEGLWWDLERACDRGDVNVHLVDQERPWWHPVPAVLDVVEADAEIWVTRTGAVSVPADDDRVREIVDGCLAEWQ